MENWRPKAKDLIERGLSAGVVARLVGVDRSSVSKARAAGWPEVQRPTRKGKEAPKGLPGKGNAPEGYTARTSEFRCAECGSAVGREHHAFSMRDTYRRLRCSHADPGRMVQGELRPSLVKYEHCGTW